MLQRAPWLFPSTVRWRTFHAGQDLWPSKGLPCPHHVLRKDIPRDSLSFGLLTPAMYVPGNSAISGTTSWTREYSLSCDHQMWAGPKGGQLSPSSSWCKTSMFHDARCSELGHNGVRLSPQPSRSFQFSKGLNIHSSPKSPSKPVTDEQGYPTS